MITFTSPITVQFRKDSPHPLPAVTIDRLDYSVTYNNSARFATAYFKALNRSILLCDGDAYDAVGQFGDVEVDGRITELLGSDIQAGVDRLLSMPFPHGGQPVRLS